jgi:hypothetical protein
MQKHKHTRAGKMMIRERYVVTVRMKMTGDLAWAAGHGKWLVLPQAEGFSRAQRRRQSTARFAYFPATSRPP